MNFYINVKFNAIKQLIPIKTNESYKNPFTDNV